MEQCMHCKNKLIFKPLPDESFACCWAHDEKVKDIDLVTGVSPAIARHGLNNVPCKRFSGGESICSLSMKEEGERLIRKAFN